MTDTSVHDSQQPAPLLGVGSSDQLGPLPERWYCVSRDGMARLCTCEEDAKIEAANAQQNYPRNGPYRAVQMVDFAAVAAERERCATLCDLSASLHWGAWDEHADPTDQGAAMEAERLAAEIRGPNAGTQPTL